MATYNFLFHIFKEPTPSYSKRKTSKTTCYLPQTLNLGFKKAICSILLSNSFQILEGTPSLSATHTYWTRKNGPKTCIGLAQQLFLFLVWKSFRGQQDKCICGLPSDERSGDFQPKPNKSKFWILWGNSYTYLRGVCYSITITQKPMETTAY